MQAKSETQLWVGADVIARLGLALGVRRRQHFAGDEAFVLAHRRGDHRLARLPAQGDAVGDLQAGGLAGLLDESDRFTRDAEPA